ncbi:uncharacterized protein LOC132281194 [Cornus florida]|uniref:uncharacterized protein LOC132281194 n=1 Tax=Cornus florida TaxID=4283 RepID=UPI00289ED36E|nr:uncharacterized protein LOC132281194 [Cornus florida]
MVGLYLSTVSILPSIFTIPLSIPPYPSPPSNRNAPSGETEFEFMLWKERSPRSCHFLGETIFKKVVMSSAPTPFASDHYQNAADQEDPHCTVMAILDTEHPKRLAFCRIGDTSWNALDSPVWGSYDDLLYFSKNKLFYAVSRSGDVESWNLSDPSSPKRSLEISISTDPPILQPTMNNHQQSVRSYPYTNPSKYLVESSGALLMVLRYRRFHPNHDESI